MTIYRFDLPLPPSANRLWRKGEGGALYVSDEARAYKQVVGLIVNTTIEEPLEGPVALDLTFYMARTNGDVDNRTKVLLDALNQHAFIDDLQVVDYCVHRRMAPKPKRGKREGYVAIVLKSIAQEVE